ncbi:MAG TPA: amino acid permease, partial [bacterium]|nr:amino acid permease [bacterium]
MSLRKELNLFDVFCIATGAMVSSGIFILPGIAHARAGPGVILSYLGAGILAGVGMLNAAELATAMPRAGGDYFFITRSLGPVIGSISGLINWFTLSLKSAFALVGMAAFARLFISIDPRITGILLCFLFVMINLAGTRHAGRAQVALVTALIVLMLVYIITGFPSVKSSHLLPIFPYGFHRTLATAGFVFVAYGGLIQISGLAEEIKRPKKNIPLGMFMALAVVTVLYTLMVLITTGVLPSETLDHSLTPITDAASQFMGAWGTRLLGAAAVLAFISTANAGIMAASRYLLALSRDDLLPRPLGRVGGRTGAPVLSTIVTGVFISAALFLKLDILVEAASLILILGFILSCVCVIILRESRVQNYRPSFRAPLYPVPQLLGILGFVLLVFELGIEAYLISAVLFLVGLGSYWAFGRKRVQRDYALLHLLQRITSRKLVTGSLERELKEIVRERDNLVTDRFDRIVSACPVVDLDDPLEREDCFALIARTVADRVGVPAESLKQMLEERERVTSTVLTPFVAIPHMVIPGEKRFEILLLRARSGVDFGPGARNV